jgi:hypothetical protein
MNDKRGWVAQQSEREHAVREKHEACASSCASDGPEKDQATDGWGGGTRNHDAQAIELIEGRMDPTRVVKRSEFHNESRPSQSLDRQRFIFVLRDLVPIHDRLDQPSRFTVAQARSEVNRGLPMVKCDAVRASGIDRGQQRRVNGWRVPELSNFAELVGPGIITTHASEVNQELIIRDANPTPTTAGATDPAND